MMKLTQATLLALCLVPMAAAQPWWVKRPSGSWRCCLTASNVDGFGASPNGAGCAVIDTSTGATCTGTLGTSVVRSRGANVRAVCTADNLGCVDPTDDWSSSFPSYVPPPPKGPSTPATPTTPTTPTPGGGVGGSNPPTGGGAGDPHFSGLDGSRFDFHGRKGGFFALLSEAQHQVNALFDNVGEEIYDGVWMTAFGFRFSSNFSLTVAIDKDAYNKRTALATYETHDGVTRMTPLVKSDIKLFINGEESDMLYTGESLYFKTPHGVASLWFPEEYVKHDNDQYDGPLMYLTTPYFDFKVYSESEGTPHFDWRVTVLSDEAEWNEMHGVVGASINWNGMPQLPGTVADYEVSSLLDTRFVFSRFDAGSKRPGRKLVGISKGTSKVGATGGIFSL